MKLIVDISKEAYNGIKMGMRNRDDMREVGEAIENGIPLDKLRAEIDRKAAYYEAEVNTDIADGMYKAIDIIDKYRAEIEG